MFIHAASDKVHLDTPLTRYRVDDSVIASFDSIYVATRENDHTGAKAVEPRALTGLCVSLGRSDPIVFAAMEEEVDGAEQ